MISTRLLRLPSLRMRSTRMPPISPMLRDVRAAAGLQVDAGNAQQAHAARAARRLHAHGLDELGPRVELLVGDPDGFGGDAARDQRVGSVLDLLGVEQAHVDVEIEPRLVRRDVAAGDRRDDDAGHHVQRGVQAHQRVAALPVELERQPLAGLRARAPGARTCTTLSSASPLRVSAIAMRSPLARTARRCRPAGRRRADRRSCGRARCRARRPRRRARSRSSGTHRL